MDRTRIQVVGNKYDLEDLKTELLSGPHAKEISLTEPEPITPNSTSRPVTRQMELYEVAVHFAIGFAATAAYEWVRDRIKTRALRSNLHIKEEVPPRPPAGGQNNPK